MWYYDSPSRGSEMVLKIMRRMLTPRQPLVRYEIQANGRVSLVGWRGATSGETVLAFLKSAF